MASEVQARVPTLPQVAAAAPPLPRPRLFHILVPREHGAWGILLVPLVTGSAVAIIAGGRWLPPLWLLVTSLALFLFRTPLEIFLGLAPMRLHQRAERRLALAGILGYGLMAALAAWALLRNAPAARLLALAAVAAATFLGQTVVRRFAPRHARGLGQGVGAFGLTATAAAGYVASRGSLDRTALVLWGVNWLFAANQIHYVHTRLRAAGARSWRQRFERAWLFLAAEFAALAALLAAAAARLVPGTALLAFAPLLLRGFWWFAAPARPLNIHRLGKTELAHALAFGLLLILAYGL